MSCVFPAPLCPTNATFRRAAASKTFMRDLRSLNRPDRRRGGDWLVE